MIAGRGWKRVLIGCSAVALAGGCGGAGSGDEEMVDIFKDGAMQRIQLKKLNPTAPDKTGPVKLKPGTAADAIVGWYDKGHGYNKEKMGGKGIPPQLRDPELLKGEAIDEDVYIHRAGSDVAEIVAPDMVQGLKSNPDLLASGAIVGWYDKGHGYNKEKMGGKELGEVVSNPALQKGAAIDGKLRVVREGQGVAEIVAPDQVQGFIRDPASLVADAIVGWYDKGHGYNKEKMGGKELGEVVSNPALQKGAAIDGKLRVVREGQGVAEIVAPDQVQGFIRDPASLVADAIVGWYDKGHGYNKEKMGGKELGEVVSNPALQKGAAIGR